jgi:hypothetical protein
MRHQIVSLQLHADFALAPAGANARVRAKTLDATPPRGAAAMIEIIAIADL